MNLSRQSRRIALIAFVIALLVIFGIGLFRAATHTEPRPAMDSGSASQSASAAAAPGR